MRDDLYLLITFQVVSTDFTRLSALVQTVVSLTAQEPGCLAYEFTVSPDRKTAYMLEHFESSAAFISHATEGFSQHAAEWNTHLNLASMIVMGNANGEARQILPPDAVYVDHIGGFFK